ncbi:hypothetical protein [Metaclostridioides mangenotii]|nr:hypothetical protein [Clostridioides mangenotii]
MELLGASIATTTFSDTIVYSQISNVTEPSWINVSANTFSQ